MACSSLTLNCGRRQVVSMPTPHSPCLVYYSERKDVARSTFLIITKNLHHELEHPCGLNNKIDPHLFARFPLDKAPEEFRTALVTSFTMVAAIIILPTVHHGLEEDRANRRRSLLVLSALTVSGILAPPLAGTVKGYIFDDQKYETRYYQQRKPIQIPMSGGSACRRISLLGSILCFRSRLFLCGVNGM